MVTTATSTRQDDEDGDRDVGEAGGSTGVRRAEGEIVRLRHNQARAARVAWKSLRRQEEGEIVTSINVSAVGYGPLLLLLAGSAFWLSNTY